MNNQEGPRTVKICNGCNHRIVYDYLDELATLCSMNNKYIGCGDRLNKTPKWCPFLKKEKQDAGIEAMNQDINNDALYGNS